MLNCILENFATYIIKEKKINNILLSLKKASKYAQEIGLDVHAGHGLTYKTAKIIRNVKYINELNIGHFIVSEALFVGLKKSISNFKKILKK